MFSQKTIAHQHIPEAGKATTMAKLRRGLVLFFAIFSTLALVGQATAPVATAETVSAQGLTVSYDRASYTNQFSFRTGKEMEVTRITISRGDGGSFIGTQAGAGLTINGKTVPTQPFQWSDGYKTVTVNLVAPTKVSASDQIVLTHRRAAAGTGNAAAIDVKIEGTVLGGQPTPTDPPSQVKRWTGSDSNGQFTMSATQGKNSEVTFSRTIEKADTLTGAIMVWAENGNGYHVEGGYLQPCGSLPRMGGLSILILERPEST